MTVRAIIGGAVLDIASLGQTAHSLYTTEGAEEAVKIVQRAAQEEFRDHGIVSPSFLLFARRFGAVVADPPTLVMIAPRPFETDLGVGHAKRVVSDAVQHLVDQLCAVGVVSTMECWFRAKAAGSERSECVLVCLEHEGQPGGCAMWKADIHREPTRLSDWEKLPETPRETRGGRFMFLQHRRPS